jgi:hypothetical protein
LARRRPLSSSQVAGSHALSIERANPAAARWSEITRAVRKNRTSGRVGQDLSKRYCRREALPPHDNVHARTIGVPSPRSRMFAGFTFRWTTPAVAAVWSASTIGMRILKAEDDNASQPRGGIASAPPRPLGRHAENLAERLSREAPIPRSPVDGTRKEPARDSQKRRLYRPAILFGRRPEGDSSRYRGRACGHQGVQRARVLVHNPLAQAPAEKKHAPATATFPSSEGRPGVG